MAKKRTRIPFYGMREQAVESLSIMLANVGKFTEAGELIKENTTNMKKKRMAPYSRLAPWVGRAILPDNTNGRWEKGQVVPRLTHNEVTEGAEA